jgi:glycosyltransferase involved in cell wall biosynthesis
MKILIVNKFLYPVGGAENYIFSLGKKLEKQANEVQYFGLKNSKNIVSNKWDILVDSYDDKNIVNPYTLIYSSSAKRQMVKLIKLFRPDIVHMNNISFHLTSSIIDACKEFNVPVVMTIHDPQLVCPNHRFYDGENHTCTECLDRKFQHCIEKKCIKNSRVKSAIACFESQMTHRKKKYDYISFYVSPSHFLQHFLVQGGYPAEKCLFLQNFVEEFNCVNLPKPKSDYFIFYGRLSEEKGLQLLLEALPDNIKLIIAGVGPLVGLIPEKQNINYVGFQSGEKLYHLIEQAKASICPSKWFENCPLSVMESISLGTPVIGANQGGIPELIEDKKTGLLFKPDDAADLRDKIMKIANDPVYSSELASNCNQSLFDSVQTYSDKIMSIYKRAIENAKNDE